MTQQSVHLNPERFNFVFHLVSPFPQFSITSFFIYFPSHDYCTKALSLIPAFHFCFLSKHLNFLQPAHFQLPNPKTVYSSLRWMQGWTEAILSLCLSWEPIALALWKQLATFNWKQNKQKNQHTPKKPPLSISLIWKRSCVGKHPKSC